MLVFKFGGASVKSADAVRNLANIVRHYTKRLVVVVSAMGKTTNALENVSYLYFNNEKGIEEALNKVRDFHASILEELFPDPSHNVYNKVNKQFENLEYKLSIPPGLNFDYEYDQIVCYGELISTIIVSEYLTEAGVNNRWIDIRRSLKSDNSFREAKINWELSGNFVNKEFIFKNEKVLLTQGFLASTINNHTTTLGREGSDYTAAILAYLLDSEMVIIWKDVPGVLNADPKWFDDTILLDHLSYKDAIELTYYGANVIHPKTIQPLKNKNINLYVKSFMHPDEPGTLIGKEEYDKLIPCFIFKMDQVLISISPKDFSFIAEDNLELILGFFAKNGLRINLMQNSAVSFQVCVNNDKTRVPSVVRDLEDHFNISWETNLELITIRYYDEDTIARVLVNKDKILEQRSKTTIQMVVKDLENGKLAN
jgi:aspartate kinase